MITDKTRGFDRRSKSIVSTYRNRTKADAARDFDPLPEIHGADELFVIAIGIKEGTAQRYGDLAGRMVQAGRAELAELFRNLEVRAREHGVEIVRWAEDQDIDIRVPTNIRSYPLGTLTEKAIAQAGGEALMTPESALNLAIHNEQRAFAFYIQIATEAVDERIRHCAEHLASEQIGHVALLRLERRRAARRRREAGIGAPPAFDDASSLAEYVYAQTCESAAQLRVAARGARAAGWQHFAERLSMLAGEHGGMGPDTVPPAAAVVEIVNRELHRAENVYEALMHTAEQSQDEMLVTVAYEHAQTTLRRLAQLSDLRARSLSGLTDRSDGKPTGS